MIACTPPDIEEHIPAILTLLEKGIQETTRALSEATEMLQRNSADIARLDRIVSALNAVRDTPDDYRAFVAQVRMILRVKDVIR